MSSSSEREARARVGTVLRKWRVDRLIDVGGMAAVYAATHRNANRVALKVLHPHLAQHEDVRERFLREGYVANKVDHPGAVSVLDDDVTDDGAPFLVMELLEGESLQTRLERPPPLSLQEALSIADQLLEVLAAAHEKNIVHRDIKPANVFLTSGGANDKGDEAQRRRRAAKGRLKLLDFGLARVRDTEGYHSITRDGIVVGTAAFMAPEQAHARTEHVDARADQWAVGALLFHVLSGRHVHEGKTMLERIVATAQKPARSLATVAPNLPASLVAVVDRALAFDKAHRFATTRDMRDALREVAAGLGFGPDVRATASARKPIAPRPPIARPESVTLDPGELVDERSIASRLAETTPVALAPISPRIERIEHPERPEREEVDTVPDVHPPTHDAPDPDDQMPTLVRPMPTPRRGRR